MAVDCVGVAQYGSDVGQDLASPVSYRISSPMSYGIFLLPYLIFHSFYLCLIFLFIILFLHNRFQRVSAPNLLLEPRGSRFGTGLNSLVFAHSFFCKPPET